MHLKGLLHLLLIAFLDLITLAGLPYQRSHPNLLFSAPLANSSRAAAEGLFTGDVYQAGRETGSQELAVFLPVTIKNAPDPTPGSRCFVNQNAGGLNTGADWANAYSDLQSALANASCTEIWVAAGVYTPGPSGERAATFMLKSGMVIYGGFFGNEASLDSRDWLANPAILSGDLDNSGSATDADAYHVVTASGVNSTAVLDGFTIRGGNANGDELDRRGGGMYSYDGNPSLANVIFSSNTAGGNGGGMYNTGGSPTLSNVTFHSNTARGDGGGMSGGGLYSEGSSPILINVTFNNNSAKGGGGGMYTYFSNPTLTNVTFNDNSAISGGGMYSYEGNPSLVNVTFVNNNASYGIGGGMFANLSNSTFANVTFELNTAGLNGGGMYNTGGSTTLSNVTFSDNRAGGDGGGLYGGGSLVNVTFSTNTAWVNGGGMSGGGRLTNVAFSVNTARVNGGGIYNEYGDSSLANGILWGNTAASGPQIYYDSSWSAPSIAYSDIQGAFAGGSWDSSLGTNGGGNLDADPRFIDAGRGNLRLSDDSPAVNAGDNTRLPADTNDLDGDGNTDEPIPYDLDGDVRIKGGMVDLGAYETR